MTNEKGETTTYEKTIEDSAFSGLKNLKKVIIDETVTTISEYAFISMSKDVMFYGYVPSNICTMCANKKYKFTEIKDGDEIDLMIKTPTPTTEQ